jgi:hypothetical protein
MIFPQRSQVINGEGVPSSEIFITRRGEPNMQFDARTGAWTGRFFPALLRARCHQKMYDSAGLRVVLNVNDCKLAG